MPYSYKDRLVTAVSAVASAGAGAFTISTSSSTYQTFGASDDGLTFEITAIEGTAWEVFEGTYTHSGTSLSRGTLLASSTGSRVTFTAAAVLTATPAARTLRALELAMQGISPGGRLTLESGVPVSTTDQTAKTSVLYTPYVSNIIPLWDGTRWVPVSFSETTLALGTLTASRPYDIFAYLSGGALALELLAWTSDTARATAVTMQDGRYCKSGDKTRLLLGSLYTTSTTTTEDSARRRLLSNIYNAAARQCQVSQTATHSYNGGYRQWNANTNNEVQCVVSLPNGQATTLSVVGEGSATGATYNIVAQGLNTRTTFSGAAAYMVGVNGFSVGTSVTHNLATGYSYVALLQSTASSGSNSFTLAYLGGLHTC